MKLFETKNRSRKDQVTATSAIEKKLTELEMGLLSMEQNTDIPEIDLQIHPIVQTIARKCNEANRKPNIQDFEEKHITHINTENELETVINEPKELLNIHENINKSFVDDENVAAENYKEKRMAKWGEGTWIF